MHFFEILSTRLLQYIYRNFLTQKERCIEEQILWTSLRLPPTPLARKLRFSSWEDYSEKVTVVGELCISIYSYVVKCKNNWSLTNKNIGIHKFFF